MSERSELLWWDYFAHKDRKGDDVEERGVIYFLWGQKHAIELLVSLVSLRQFNPSIPVTILTPEPKGISAAFAADKRLNVQLAPLELCKVGRRNAAFVTKTWLQRFTPYRLSLFLDADTIVNSTLEGAEIWPTRAQEVTWTAFSDWRTLGSPYEARCERPFREKLAEPGIWELAKAENAPAVNNGVYAFWKDAQALEEIHALAKKIHSVFIPDEVATQLLYRSWPHKLVDHTWNHSPRHGRFEPAKVNVWHCHGSKHLHRRTKTLWLHYFAATLEHKYAGVYGDDWGELRSELFRYQQLLGTRP